MKTNELMTTVSRSVSKIGFKFRKHSPELLLGLGIAGTVASTVMACKATTKVHDILEETKTELDAIHAAGERLENGEVLKLKDGGEYTVEQNKKDLVTVYAQTGFKFIKLYGPSVLLGAASIASIVSGHKILRKRNFALAAAYATVDKGFKEYRSRVVERFGNELDKELRYNIKAQEVDEIIVDPETGEETTVVSTVNVPDFRIVSDYARFFDETCTGHSKDPELNLMFLKRQQDYANDRLKRKGFLFLNDVYEMLGMSRSVAGQTVGWLYDEKNPVGDNYVDFGIYDNNWATRRFVNGLETNILLDFNVDGDILHSGNFEL